MSRNDRPLWADLRDELSGLRNELAEMVLLRWELARLELQAASQAVRRAAIVVTAASIGALTALPVLVVLAAETLDGRLGVSKIGWLALFGAGLLVVAATAVFAAVRRFRRETGDLRQSWEELREDAVWIREWLSRPDRTTPESSSDAASHAPSDAASESPRPADG